MISKQARAFGPRLLFCAVLFCTGCVSNRPLPPFDTSAPGWSVRQGQALWRPDEDKPEIVGDVVLSTHPDAGTFVQFSKTVPILSARLAPSAWEFNAIAQQKVYSGRGSPPDRIAWLQALLVLEGAEAASRWTVARPSDKYLLLENSHTGERLELRLN
ncbi:MAG TPA: hypothetical protein VF773_15065 [Verrucomicrobiae bacterium]